MNIEEIIKNIKWELVDINKTDGQRVSMLYPPHVTLISEELDIKITVGFYRSIYKNKELALSILNTTINQLLDEKFP